MSVQQRNLVMGVELKDYIKVYDDAVKGDFCDVTIETFETKGRPQYLDRQQSPTFHDLNISQRYIDKDPWWMGIQHQLNGVFEDTTKRYIEELDLKNEFPGKYEFEEYRIKKYENNGYDRFKDHVDVFDHESARRFLVGFLYLNDVEEGGETEFYHQNLKIKPKQGTLVIFPTYFTHLHRGNPPISNRKYIINKWCLPI